MKSIRQFAHVAQVAQVAPIGSALFGHRVMWSLALLIALAPALAVWAQSPDVLNANDKDAGKPTIKGQADAQDDQQPQPQPQPQLTIDEQHINLRPMFEQGRTSIYSFWSQRDRNVQVQFNGQSRATAVRMTFQGQVTWAVRQVNPDGSASCTMTYDFIVATIQAGDTPAQVEDSRKGPGENTQIHRFLQAMTGVPVEVQMSTAGVAQSVSGTQVILQKLGDDLKAMAPADEEHIESAMELATLPGAPDTLAVGQSWSANYDWKHELGRMKMDTTYHLANVESIAGIPIATINTSAKPVIVPDYSKIPANGPKVNIRQTQGNYQGQIIFDLQRHDTVGSNSVNTTDLEITVSLPNNQTIIRNVKEKLQSQMLRIKEVK